MSFWFWLESCPRATCDWDLGQRILAFSGYVLIHCSELEFRHCVLTHLSIPELTLLYTYPQVIHTLFKFLYWWRTYCLLRNFGVRQSKSNHCFKKNPLNFCRETHALVPSLYPHTRFSLLATLILPPVIFFFFFCMWHVLQFFYPSLHKLECGLFFWE